MLTETLTEVRDRPSVNKRTAQKFGIKNRNEMEARGERVLKTNSKFAALHN